MSQTLTVVFDGHVLHPDTPINLEPNKRYVITIQPEVATLEKSDAWDVLEKFAGTVEAPSDWAREHDHYLYGTPKNESETNK